MHPSKPKIAHAGLVANALRLPAAAGLVALVALTALAFRQAPTHAAVQVGAFVQRGEYGYAAHVHDGTVRIRFAFRYRFESARPHRVHGTLWFGLALRSSKGWALALPGPPALRFRGTTAHLTQTIDLDEVQRTLTRYLDETALRTSTFALEVVPQVRVRGEVEGTAINQPFAPKPLWFGIGDHALRPLSTASHASKPADDPLRPSRVGAIWTSVPSRIDLLVANPTVALLRRDAPVGAAGLGALLAIVLLLRRSGGRGLVAVPNAVILQHAGRFYVEADGAAYRYRLAAAPSA
jgi:hypothetical protein